MNSQFSKFPKLAVLLLLLFVLSGTSGCPATFKKVLNEEPALPMNDRVLVYDKPYDFTFLKTIEALNTFPEWVLEETDKNRGMIRLRNTQFGHLFDKDKWVVEFAIRRLDKRKTSVALAEDSQRHEKGEEFLNRIDEIINLTSGSKSAQTPAETTPIPASVQ